MVQPDGPGGSKVRAVTASSRGRPNATTFCSSESRLEEEPARVSVPRRVALPPFISMGCPPSSYSPSGMPAQRRESLMMTSLSPNSLWVARMTAGWMCRPSQIKLHRGAAVQGRADDPGSRWRKEGMALKRWVAWLAPAP